MAGENEYLYMAVEEIVNHETGEILAFQREAITGEMVDKIHTLELPGELIPLGAWSDGTKIFCVHCKAQFLGYRLAVFGKGCDCNLCIPILAESNGAFPFWVLNAEFYQSEEV